MKFGQYLRTHAIDEWKRAYIDYRQLKKQIGRAEQELLAIDAGDAEDSSAGVEDESGPEASLAALEADRKRAAAARGARAAAQGAAAGPNLHEVGVVRGRNRDVERGLDGLDDENEQATTVRSAKSPAEAPARRLSSRSSQDASPALSPTFSQARWELSPEHDSDDTQGTGQALIRESPADAGAKDDLRPAARMRSFSRPKPPTRDFNSPAKRKWRTGFSPDMSLRELQDAMPKQSRRFVKMLDRELERVSGFYADREGEAVERYEQLSAQWRELVNHKKEFQAFRQRELQPPQIVSSILPKHAHLPNVPGVGLVRRTLAQRKVQARGSDEHNDEVRGHNSASGNKSRRFSSESQYSNGHADGPAPKADRDSDADDEAPDAQPVYRHGRPEDYTNARSRLKLATFEYYRFLGMLKSYRVLNRTGFTKALKKYDKVTLIPLAARYAEKVDKADFVTSTKLDDLIRETEDAFATAFERGDRKKALERLRDFGEKKGHHFTSWRAGMLMGAGLPLMIEGLVLSFKPSVRQEIPYWAALLQLFGACYLPVFFCLAFFLNLAACYVLIFELDIRNKMDYHQFIEIPALLYFILSLFWWAAWNNFWPGHIEPSAYPLAWIVVALSIMLNPLPILYPSARWWMLRSFLRMISAGLVRVSFADFFLGDLFNSIYYSLYNLGFLYCTYSHHWQADVYSVCSTNKTWTTAVLASLPPFWRLGQSIRRYFDSDGAFLHVLNAGKYCCSIIYFWFYFAWRINQERGNEEAWRFALFILFATINSCYTSAWDVLMDWSLGHRDVKKKGHWMLRNELAFFKDRPWVYYIAAVANVVLRFSWVFYLAPRPATGVQSYTIALIEASRRIMWNTFRVEAEHIGNRDGYRVTRDVPLPYVSAASPEASGQGADENDDDEDPLEGATSLRARFFRSAHALHRSLVDNLSPVVDAIFSPTVLALGRREDPAARERREVEHQQRRRRRAEDNSSDEEDERDGPGGAQPSGDDNTTDNDNDGSDRLSEHEKRQRVRQSELERRRRRRKSIFLNSGDDESSSPDTSTETESRSGRTRRERGNCRTRSRAGSSPPGQGRDDNSDRHERGDADIGEESLAAPKEDRDVDSGAATTPSPGPTAEHLDETSGDAALQREVAEAERMTEMAESGGA
ncbi:hypothetical protein C6P46_005342 [Rhodotorula mucilaginosa]|uniref:Uncharacterized protein n=1 Tax=Rhodotorula mucilaginosa TaxID=5537 RepID=A0A9P6VY02_RHOMI|nr:hypothetical protein C6P46_005342 [Rhodotorula mucilaginosa]